GAADRAAAPLPPRRRRTQRQRLQCAQAAGNRARRRRVPLGRRRSGAGRPAVRRRHRQRHVRKQPRPDAGRRVSVAAVTEALRADHVHPAGCDDGGAARAAGPGRRREGRGDRAGHRHERGAAAPVAGADGGDRSRLAQLSVRDRGGRDRMTVEGLNAALDRLPRTHVASAAREAPAFRASGVTGFYGALLALTAGGLLAGRSWLVLAAIALVAAASFFVWAFVRRAVSGREEVVLLEHVWFAEACVAGGLAAIGEPVLPYLDVLAVALCVFLAGGRIGCLVAGCCFGRPSSLGIRYGPEAADDGFPRHLVGVRLLPVPAFEAAGLLVLGAAGLAALPPAHAGVVFPVFLASYAVLRFGLEALRGDRRPHVLGLSVNRWMCVTELGVALTI